MYQAGKSGPTVPVCLTHLKLHKVRETALLSLENVFEGDIQEIIAENLEPDFATQVFWTRPKGSRHRV